MNQVRLVLTRTVRPFSMAPRVSFLQNIFGSREAKNKEIIEKQDDYEVDPNSKIVILNKENSPSYEPFDAARDIPDFKIVQWKDRVVKAQDIENSVSSEMISNAILEAYTGVFQKPVTVEEYASTNLDDLEKRFQLTKRVQQILGFDIKDHTISRSHTLAHLHDALKKQVAHRWSSERNPNAIVLRPEDFSGQGNVYLNEERNDAQQKQFFDELREKVSNAAP